MRKEDVKSEVEHGSMSTTVTLAYAPTPGNASCNNLGNNARKTNILRRRFTAFSITFTQRQK